MRRSEQPSSLSDAEPPISIELGELLSLAVDAWRLETWLATVASTVPTNLPRHALRGLKSLLHRNGIEVLDLTGHPYEPGLALEIVESIRDMSLGERGPVIDETVSPILLRKGRVVQLGKVVVRIMGEPLPLSPSDFLEVSTPEVME